MNVWSAMVRFSGTPGDVVLNPCQAVGYTASIGLFDLTSGSSLAAGSYTIRMWLAGTNSASLSFPITVRYTR